WSDRCTFRRQAGRLVSATRATTVPGRCRRVAPARSLLSLAIRGPTTPDGASPRVFRPCRRAWAPVQSPGGRAVLGSSPAAPAGDPRPGNAVGPRIAVPIGQQVDALAGAVRVPIPGTEAAGRGPTRPESAATLPERTGRRRTGATSTGFRWSEAHD